MIDYKRHKLSNGLRVLLHLDKETPMVAVNVLYNVGAKHEQLKHKGLAHLFEHLMFEGSLNVEDFDEELDAVGGQNNAFTNNDYTNYYLSIPADNLETALWLESDRMLQLQVDHEGLEIQKKVVIEEFKQVYLNQPYGDEWLLLRPLCYDQHPYKWNTIGESTQMIEKIQLDDAKSFYDQFYNPQNAIISIAGNIDEAKTLDLIQKWFGTIENRTGDYPLLNNHEPEQKSAKFLSVQRNVPASRIFMSYHMGGRLSVDYYHCDVLSDILGGGMSSTLYKKLVKEQAVFSQVDCYISGETDCGLFIITGDVLPDVTLEYAQACIEEILSDLMEKGPDVRELEKIRNKAEMNIAADKTDVMNIAMELAYAEYLGDPELINSIYDHYKSISIHDVQKAANKYFRQENLNVLHYLSKK